MRAQARISSILVAKALGWEHEELTRWLGNNYYKGDFHRGILPQRGGRLRFDLETHFTLPDLFFLQAHLRLGVDTSRELFRLISGKWAETEEQVKAKRAKAEAAAAAGQSEDLQAASRSFLQAIARALDKGTPTELPKYGVRVERAGTRIWLAVTHPRIVRLYKQCGFGDAAALRKTLIDNVPGTTRGNTAKFGGHASRCIVLRRDEIEQAAAL